MLLHLIKIVALWPPDLRGRQAQEPLVSIRHKGALLSAHHWQGVAEVPKEPGPGVCVFRNETGL
jgi:hypothetical protein